MVAGCGLFACFLPQSSHSRKQRNDFLEAAKTGDVSFTRRSLSMYPEIVKSTTFMRRKSALHLAAESGHLTVLSSIVEALLTSPALSGTNGSGRAAARYVRALLDIQDSKGQTPLILACGHGHEQCVKFLLDNGADRALGDHRGNQPLHYGTAKGYLAVMYMLLAGTGDNDGITLEAAALMALVDARNSVGFSSLHYAVWAKQTGAVQVLLQHGADITARNTRTAIDIIPCCSNSTPLHLAAMRGHIEISRIILKTFAERIVEPLALPAGTAVPPSTVRLDPRVQCSHEGLVPYQVAQRQGHVTLAMLLRPNIPIARLFTEEERNVRFYGPPSLKALCAETLNKHLCSSIDAIAAACEPPNLVALAAGDLPHSSSPASAPAAASPPTAAAAATPPLPSPAAVASAPTPSRSRLASPRASALHELAASLALESAAHHAVQSPRAGGRPGERDSGGSGSLGGDDGRLSRQRGSGQVPASGDWHALVDAGGRPDARTQLVSTSFMNLIIPRAAEIQEAAAAPLAPLAPPSRFAPPAVPRARRATDDHSCSPSPVVLPATALLARSSSESSSRRTAPTTPHGGDGGDDDGEGHDEPMGLSSLLHAVAQHGSRRIDPLSMPLSPATAAPALPFLDINTVAHSSPLLDAQPPAPAAAPPRRPLSLILSMPRQSRGLAPLVLPNGGSAAAVGGGQPAGGGLSPSPGRPGSARSGHRRAVSMLSPPGSATGLSPMTTPTGGDGKLASPALGGSGGCLTFDAEALVATLPSLDTFEAAVLVKEQQRTTDEGCRASRHSHLLGGAVDSSEGLSLSANPLFENSASMRSTAPSPHGTLSSALPALGGPAAADAAGHWGGDHGGGDDDDDNECGVCLEHFAAVSIQPCRHALCGPCARKLCSMSQQKASLCPFCRSLISSFVANTKPQ